MCGIFAYLGDQVGDEELKNNCELIKHRGPDNTHYVRVNPDVFFGFHRLAINGKGDAGDQPMTINGITLICNGEIYNYKELALQHGFQYSTGSDCEVIIHLYKTVGIHECCLRLDGEFAFVLYDSEKKLIYAARDHLGVRPLYTSYKYQEDIGTDMAFASEAKALCFMDMVEQFPPRSWWCSDQPDEFNTYYSFDYAYDKFAAEIKAEQLQTEAEISESLELFRRELRHLLTEAVRKRFTIADPDVEIGCLLSGGLDSSLVSALCASFCMDGRKLKTFSIGMAGSPDLRAAKIVAEHIGSDHYSVELSERDFLNAVIPTIYTLGSYDVTTVRASVGHRLISQWVRDNTSVKVLLSGEVADECSGSYLYFGAAPSPGEFQQESVRLLNDIHFFDNLRSDRSISSAGLEARVPFSDRAFLEYYMRIPAKYKMFGGKIFEGKIFEGKTMEKQLLREAFSGAFHADGKPLLPDEILWRRKNGFSDSVSARTRSWSVIVGEWIDTIVSDEVYHRETEDKTTAPRTKEAWFYKKIFDEWYDGFDNLTPYQWLPKWCGDVVDPSARTLSIYEAD